MPLGVLLPLLHLLLVLSFGILGNCRRSSIQHLASETETIKPCFHLVSAVVAVARSSPHFEIPNGPQLLQVAEGFQAKDSSRGRGKGVHFTRARTVLGIRRLGKIWRSRHEGRRKVIPQQLMLQLTQTHTITDSLSHTLNTVTVHPCKRTLKMHFSYGVTRVQINI